MILKAESHQLFFQEKEAAAAAFFPPPPCFMLLLLLLPGSNDGSFISQLEERPEGAAKNAPLTAF